MYFVSVYIHRNLTLFSSLLQPSQTGRRGGETSEYQKRWKDIGVLMVENKYALYKARFAFIEKRYLMA